MSNDSPHFAIERLALLTAAQQQSTSSTLQRLGLLATLDRSKPSCNKSLLSAYACLPGDDSQIRRSAMQQRARGIINVHQAPTTPLQFLQGLDLLSTFKEDPYCKALIACSQEAKDTSRKLMESLHMYKKHQQALDANASAAARNSNWASSNVLTPRHAPGQPMNGATAPHAQLPTKRPLPPGYPGQDACGAENESKDEQAGTSAQGFKGFVSARHQYNKEVAAKPGGGNPLPPGQPRQASGLMRPSKRPAVSGGRGFVPPFVQKGLDGPEGVAGAGASKAAGQAGGEERPWSDQAIRMLADENGEMPEEIAKLDPKIVNAVVTDVVDNDSSQTQWEDIAGLKDVKEMMYELIVWPSRNPELFTGVRTPPKGVLLFGPPGTGKTMIGRAVASQLHATFFAISASSLTSKWIGEGEKLVTALFVVAKVKQPSVIFIDEIDSILTKRKEDEHESSRRLKTQILICMEGVASASEDRVLVVGATNRPEELDDAARRRMPKQIYVPLPDLEARVHMVKHALRKVHHKLTDMDMAQLSERTVGYSGSDMRGLLGEVCSIPIRDAQKQLGDVTGLTAADLRPVSVRDFKAALGKLKPSVSQEEISRYIAYDKKHGVRVSAGLVADEDENDEW